MMVPLLSVVVETITPRENPGAGAIVRDLESTLGALARQTYPRDRLECIVILDPGIAAADAEELRRLHPEVVFGTTPRVNYYAAKNAGAALARGEIVTFLDGDCEPAEDWLERLVEPFASDVDVVAGRTCYPATSFAGRTQTVSDFSNVVGTRAGVTGINLNNVAFRRELFLAHRLDERLRRNGGCYLLFHQLREAGARFAYAANARTTHRLDASRHAHFRKHFERGYDGVSVYRVDDADALRGSRWLRRFGAPALVPLTARRVLADWVRLMRERRQIGIPFWTLPYYAGVMLTTRLFELTGGFAAFIAPRMYGEER